MRRILKAIVFVTLFLCVIVIGMVFSSDPISSKLRSSFEFGTNNYIEKLAHRASSNDLTLGDRIVLRSSVSLGILVSKINYPEASMLLKHYIRGDGADLELDSDYFKSSEYLKQVVLDLGPGNHGPIALRQNQDWRLSLALNPYYLDISEKLIRIYHPKIEFAAANNPSVYTRVPIGKIELKVYDSLVSALDVTPFYVYSMWSR